MVGNILGYKIYFIFNIYIMAISIFIILFKIIKNLFNPHNQYLYVLGFLDNNLIGNIYLDSILTIIYLIPIVGKLLFFIFKTCFILIFTPVLHIDNNQNNLLNYIYQDYLIFDQISSK